MTTSISNPNTPKLKITEWLIDTRPLWPEAQKTKDLEKYATTPLSLLPPSTAAGVLKYYHLKDAKLSLLSHLAKRFAISSLLGIPWSQAEPRRDESKGGKPEFPGIAFNVSHQAGVVGCVAVVGYGGDGTGGVEVGIDIVSTTERRDRDRGLVLSSQSGGGNSSSYSSSFSSSSSRLHGFKKFVAIHSEVFGRGETDILLGSKVVELLNQPTPTTRNGGPAPPGLDETDKRLRAFYALWCLREAYVKMTGEALLANWLADLEFRGWMAPAPVGREVFELPGRSEKDGEEAGLLKNPEIWLHGERVYNTNIVLRSLGRGIMVSTAARTPGRTQDALDWRLGRYDALDLETILRHAEANP